MPERNTSNWPYLIEKYLTNRISKEELELLLQQANTLEDVKTLKAVLKDYWHKQPAGQKKDWNAKFEAMMEELKQPAPVISIQKNQKKRWIYRITAAAAILFVVATTAFFLWNNKNEKRVVVNDKKKEAQKNDFLPGKNTAILTLADGSTIVLDSAKNGELTNQGNTKVIKLGSGQLAYNSTDATSEVLYNTMSTPRGGQYKLVLADGSKVWLNAASSIHYPASFPGNERKVEITGEAYFEVVHDATKPFKVSVNNMEVQVLGTHFNVNAYMDERTINTTLLEGSVKVTKGSSMRILKPGQQAILHQAGDDKTITVENKVDLEAVIAWKNGYFSFTNADMSTVMKQISRWYDVDIIYEGKIPDRKFGGEISRNLNASQALKILEASKVHFRIEGKKIIVLP